MKILYTSPPKYNFKNEMWEVMYQRKKDKLKHTKGFKIQSNAEKFFLRLLTPDLK